jgi:hypothetical protein
MNNDVKDQTMAKVSTQEVLAASIFAFEVNEHTIIRDTVHSMGPIEMGSVVQWSNKQIITAAMSDDPTKYLYTKCQTFDNQINITDKHREQAQEMVTYLTHAHLLKTLTTGQNDNFLQDIVNTISLPEITMREVGIMAWAPKLCKDFKEKDEIREKCALYEPKSTFIGRVGDWIDLHFELIDCRYVSKDIHSYSVLGHDENGNLVSFWHKEKMPTSVRMKAKVKGHLIDKYHNDAKITRLNYVKNV